VRKVTSAGFDLMVGSSGTAVNLGEMVAAARGERPATMRRYTITLREIQRIREALCRLPLEERRKVPGIKPERADIMVAGVAVIETLMQETGSEELQISEQGLRDGLVIDRLLREDGAREVYLQTPPRRRSVLKLARACGYEAEHCEQVRRLCVQLFDQMRDLGLHSMDAGARELLEYAAYLHDIGFFLSHTDHHQHAYYIIRNSELLGSTTGSRRSWPTWPCITARRPRARSTRTSRRWMRRRALWWSSSPPYCAWRRDWTAAICRWSKDCDLRRTGRIPCASPC